MLKLFVGIFVILHGLVHLWYFALSQRLVEFKPEMGWSGESWLFKHFMGESAIRSLATVFFILIAALFVISGVGFLLNTGWWRLIIITSSILSLLVLLIFWDGNINQLVEKGLIGFLVNIAILVIILK